MGDVVILPVITSLDCPAERILSMALQDELDKVVIMGYHKDGSEFFASSIADGGTVLWMMERSKIKLMDVATRLEE